MFRTKGMHVTANTGSLFNSYRAVMTKMRSKSKSPASSAESFLMTREEKEKPVSKCCHKCKRRRLAKREKRLERLQRRPRSRRSSIESDESFKSRTRTRSRSRSSSWDRFRGSRSPSIPIDPHRTSPSHLEVRRITSARKLPVPYNRRWDSSDSDSDSSIYDKRPNIFRQNMKRTTTCFM
nr:serine/arginine repetitive matrix protein 4 [Ciona intestinalis]|eukprot:XP_026694906.1 serine/arginine repetitive matrix protein 4 [Ciona intestinalis]